jgi:hypothetical protein
MLGLALLLGLGIRYPAEALEAEAPLEEIESCVRGNLHADSSVQTVEMIPRDRMGAERTIGAKIYWKRFEDGYSRLLARFTEPADIEGAGFLLIETEQSAEMHLYMPELRKTRRITSQALRGSIYGTDFSYEDFERLQGFNHAETRKLEPPAEVDGRPVFVLAAHPAPGSGSAYEKIVSYVDQEKCVPLKIELYEPPGRVRKLLIMDASQVERSGESWVPRELLMRDLRDETQTLLRLLSVEVGAEIPNRTFRLGTLGRKSVP